MSLADQLSAKNALLNKLYQHCLSFFASNDSICRVDDLSIESFRKHLVDVNHKFDHYVKIAETQAVSELVHLPDNKLSVFETNRMVNQITKQIFDDKFYKHPSVDRLMQLMVEDNHAQQELYRRQVQVGGVTYLADEVINLPGDDNCLWLVRVGGCLKVATINHGIGIWVDRDYIIKKTTQYQAAVTKCQDAISMLDA